MQLLIHEKDTGFFCYCTFACRYFSSFEHEVFFFLVHLLLVPNRKDCLCIMFHEVSQDMFRAQSIVLKFLGVQSSTLQVALSLGLIFSFIIVHNWKSILVCTLHHTEPTIIKT